jgi:hypothetical protein
VKSFATPRTGQASADLRYGQVVGCSVHDALPCDSARQFAPHASVIVGGNEHSVESGRFILAVRQVFRRSGLASPNSCSDFDGKTGISLSIDFGRGHFRMPEGSARVFERELFAGFGREGVS